MDQPGELKVLVVCGTDLVPKDLNGKSDPYYVLGLLGHDGKWIGKPFKSKVVKNTLQPKWMDGARVFKMPQNNATYLRLEVWDHDFISKDEFMGACNILLSEIEETSTPQGRHFILEQRVGREGKDRVTGDVYAEVHWISDSFKARLQKKERDLRTSADKMVESAPKSSLALDKIRAAAEALIVAGHRGVITDKDQLREVLEKLGVFNSVTALDALMWSDYEAMFLPKDKADTAAVAEALRAPEVREARAALFWDMLDVNKDGQIDFNELLLGIAMNTESQPEERAQFYFDIFDLNKDGTLSADEVFALQSTCMRALAGAIRTALYVNLKRRAQTKMVMSDEQLRAACDKCVDNINKLSLASRTTEYIFETVDKDKNGSITREEFKEFLCDKNAQESLRALMRTALKELSETNNKTMDAEFERALARSIL